MKVLLPFMFVFLIFCEWSSAEEYLLINTSPMVKLSRPTTFICSDLTRQPSIQQLKLRRSFTKRGLRDPQIQKTVFDRYGLQYNWKRKVSRALGSFKCGTENNEATSVKIFANGLLRPESLSKYVAVGSEVDITMIPVPSSQKSGTVKFIDWWKNAERLTNLTGRIKQMGSDGRTLSISNVTLDDAGVYMAYYRNKTFRLTAATILFVRRCAKNMWSSNCSLPCPTCVNGGYCSESSGLCICPPGFNGSNCSLECPVNTFGPNCQISCQQVTGKATCRGALMCQRSGCSCAYGWSGLNCDHPCSTTSSKLKNQRFPECFSKQRLGILGTHSMINDAMYEYKQPQIINISARPSFKVNQGQTVTILCSATGKPLPRHGEIVIKTLEQQIYPISTSVTSEVTTSKFSFVMKEPPVSPYYCIAHTSAGKNSAIFNFTIPVLPKPINPPLLIKAFISNLIINLNSRNYSGDGPIVRREVFYKRSDQTSFVSYRSQIFNDTIVVASLQPYTLYNFRVLLYRQASRSSMEQAGPMATFRTKCGKSISGPTIRLSYAKSDTSLFISWKNPPVSEINGEILGYKIFYKKLGEESNEKMIRITRKGMTSAALKQLTPLSVYRVKMLLFNCAGDSPFSNKVRAITGHLERPTKPHVFLANRTSRSLSFQWEVPANAQPYTITNYEFYFDTVKDRTDNVVMLHKNTSQLHYVIENLIPFTSYSFRVRGYNPEEAGTFSDVTYAETLEGAPTAPINIKILKTEINSISLSWEQPLHSNGIIRSYDVEMSVSPALDSQKSILSQNSTIKVMKLQNLNEYSKYWFRVRAHTVMYGDWSKEVTARTMISHPLQTPLITEVHAISPQSVNIVWKSPPPSPYVNNITAYKVIYTDDIRQNNERWKTKGVSGQSRSLKIDGLKADTVYFFKVAAKSDQLGDFSEEETIRTAKMGLPPPPRDTMVLRVMATNATLSWSLRKGYRITIVKIRHLRGNYDLQSPLVEAEYHQVTLTHLKPDTSYDVEIIACNYIGESSNNPVLRFHTKLPDVISDERRNPVPVQNTLLFKIAVVAFGVLFLVFVILFVFYCRCRGKSHQTQQSPTYPTITEMDTLFPNVRCSTMSSSQLGPGISRTATMLSSLSVHSAHSRAVSTHSCQLFPEHLIIPWENILFEDIPLGVGNFGQVVKAVVQKDQKLIQTAVKMLKEGSTLDDKRDFLAELDTMVRIGHHKNIISLVGACEHEYATYLCTEFAPHGNLLQFLRKNRKLEDEGGTYTNLSQTQLLNFANDVAQGMAYLSEKQLIHRDLAARNILLGEGHTAKIADFGLSRGEGVYVKKTVSRLPIRWMAIESLNYNVYTTKSDVWSFGILLWEIVSLGGTPYCGMSCAELYEKLPIGYRMEKPLNCDDEMYTLMFQCWKDRPYDRPTFSQLCVALERMSDARSSRNYVNTAIFEEFKFANIDVTEEEG